MARKSSRRRRASGQRRIQAALQSVVIESLENRVLLTITPQVIGYYNDFEGHTTGGGTLSGGSTLATIDSSGFAARAVRPLPRGCRPL